VSLAADGTRDVRVNLIGLLWLVNHLLNDVVQTVDSLTQLCTSTTEKCLTQTS